MAAPDIAVGFQMAVSRVDSWPHPQHQTKGKHSSLFPKLLTIILWQAAPYRKHGHGLLRAIGRLLRHHGPVL
jgi:hypothetical protein